MRPDSKQISSSDLSRKAGEFALTMLEQEPPIIVHNALVDHGGDVTAELRACGALTGVGSQRSVVAIDEAGQPHHIDLEWIPDRRAYGYFTSDGYVVPDPASLQLYELQLGWWIEWLTKELNLVDASAPHVLVKDHAWDLGNLWVARNRKIPVLFARRLRHASVASQVIKAIADRGGRPGGILLSSSKRRSPFFLLPHGYQARSVGTLLAANLERMQFDLALVRGAFLHPGAEDSHDLVSLSPDFHTLMIDGHLMVFRGQIQQMIVKQLVDAYRANERHPMKQVLKKAGSSAPDFAKAFKNNPSWPMLRKYLKTEQGLCWIEP